MPRLALTALLVADYDEAIAFYVGKLGFDLLEDTIIKSSKRWVVVAPPGGHGALLLARAEGDRQCAAIGDQSGGRVFLFLETDDFARSCCVSRLQCDFHRTAAHRGIWDRRRVRGSIRQSVGSNSTHPPPTTAAWLSSTELKRA